MGRKEIGLRTTPLESRTNDRAILFFFFLVSFFFLFLFWFFFSENLSASGRQRGGVLISGLDDCGWPALPVLCCVKG
jgi:hypothetical protein